ncbi:8-amino-7-oxononanoate synthase [Chlamydiota bacterium]
MFDTIISEELKSIKSSRRYRAMKCVEQSQGPELVINGKAYSAFCSNNYLGLADNPYIKKAAIEGINSYGVGAGASRLISGNMSLHETLEKRIAQFKKKDEGLVFTSGYMANLGSIQALVGKDDLVIIDKFNHASIIDGCRLSGAHLRVYPHKNMEKLERILKTTQSYQKKLLVTDSLFSMDGDIAPLREIVKLAKTYDVIILIDEAHATGVFGKNGQGVADYLGVQKDVDIIMGTFSKALGSLGGYVVGSKPLINFLRNKARSFMYTTGISPALCAASLAGIEYCESNQQLRDRLWDNTRYLQSGLICMGFQLKNTDSQIIPLIIGDEERTMALATFLFSQKIFIPGIRPPTVPKETSRLRISVMATHTKEQLDKCLDSFGKAKKKGLC